MRFYFAGAIVFLLLGCYGSRNGGEEDPNRDLICSRTTTNVRLFDIKDYEGQRVSSLDALSAYQWHLKNFAQKTGAGTNDYSSKAISSGADLRVESAWNYATGNGVIIAVIDTGMDASHPDLKPNYNAALSWNYVKNQQDPYPYNTTVACAHGTATAGIAAAKGGNGGAIGVAPDATIAALNIGFCENANASNSEIADALSVARTSRGNNLPIDIFSNSWGCHPTANPCYVASETVEAITEGAAYGRNGKGSIYIFAAGNYRYLNERSDHSPLLNLFEVLPIAALDAQDKYAIYSNSGANLLVSAYGGYGGDRPGILTTDIVGCNTGFNADRFMQHKENRYGGFTTLMNGSSAATPMAAGAVALMLETNHNLTQREVRYILATTARKNDPSDSDWKQNGAGWNINHNYGFGAIDAYNAVQTARSFISFGALLERNASAFNANPINISDTRIAKIEYVDINVKLNKSYDDKCGFNLTLKRDGATDAVFMKNDRSYNIVSGGDYHFATPRFLDESDKGIWSLTLDYLTPSCPNGLGIDWWKIRIRGRN
ncbi:MAG: S8 family serine peptidase [Helicobacteraceae bacterium]|jgi:subtilisin family serine protease|nr:S8 family serine peptidase [Helicobacteraceae bacterium]